MVEETEPAVRQVEADRDLIREGDRPSKFVMVLDGFACSYKTMEDGKRQTLSFHMAGDLCGLAGLHLARLDSGTRTLTPATVALIPHAAVAGWRRHPRLRDFLWRTAVVDAAVAREWIVNVGRRAPYQRTAHLLCEIVSRLQGTLGLPGPRYGFPFTQLDLADALGLTGMHTGRMLQQLHADRLAELGGGSLTVRNWRGLRQAAEFDPGYLQEFGDAGARAA